MWAFHKNLCFFHVSAVSFLSNKENNLVRVIRSIEGGFSALLCKLSAVLPIRCPLLRGREACLSEPPVMSRAIGHGAVEPTPSCGCVLCEGQKAAILIPLRKEKKEQVSDAARHRGATCQTPTMAACYSLNSCGDRWQLRLLSGLRAVIKREDATVFSNAAVTMFMVHFLCLFLLAEMSRLSHDQL